MSSVIDEVAMLPKVDVREYKHFWKSGLTNNKIVNIRGTNGAGKSTIPFSLLADDKDAFELTYYIEDKERVLATVFPTFNWLALGSYRTKCGGLDSYQSTEQTIDSLNLVWNFDYNILMEGVLSSTVYSTYADLFTTINNQHINKRKIMILSLLPPFETCLARIYARNGGKKIKEELVLRKYKSIHTNVQKFADAGLISISVDNSTINKEDTRHWFLDIVNKNM